MRRAETQSCQSQSSGSKRWLGNVIDNDERTTLPSTDHFFILALLASYQSIIRWRKAAPLQDRLDFEGQDHPRAPPLTAHRSLRRRWIWSKAQSQRLSFHLGTASSSWTLPLSYRSTICVDYLVSTASAFGLSFFLSCDLRSCR